MWVRERIKRSSTSDPWAPGYAAAYRAYHVGPPLIMGKARDEKVHILPSTTRKGIALSTSAALDSPFVMSQLITPPQTIRTVISAESENASDNFDYASTLLDESGSLGHFLDATLAKSKQIENAETDMYR